MRHKASQRHRVAKPMPNLLATTACGWPTATAAPTALSRKSKEHVYAKDDGTLNPAERFQPIGRLGAAGDRRRRLLLPWRPTRQ